MSSLRPFSQGPGPHRGQEGQAELKPLGGGTHLREDRVIRVWRVQGGWSWEEVAENHQSSCGTGLALEVTVTLRH